MSVLRGPVVRRLRPGIPATLESVEPFAAAWAVESERALASEGPLWIALGDSTAQGVGAAAYDLGYVGQLRRLLEARDGIPWRVVNLSVTGARVAEVLDGQVPRLHELVGTLPVPPGLVTCTVGPNDVIRPLGFGRVPAALAALIRQLPRGAVLGDLPQGIMQKRAGLLNDVIRRDAVPAGLRVAPVRAHTGPPWQGKFAADNFHPNELGYVGWCTAFAEAIGLEPGTGNDPARAGRF